MAAVANTTGPFSFTAEKAADGTVTFTGNVPDKDVDDALSDAIHVTIDNTTVKSGAPIDFSGDAVAALGVLAGLDSGKVTFDGSAWSISGAVDSADKAMAASSNFDSSPLKAVGASYDVSGPASPATATGTTTAGAATPVPLASASTGVPTARVATGASSSPNSVSPSAPMSTAQTASAAPPSTAASMPASGPATSGTASATAAAPAAPASAPAPAASAVTPPAGATPAAASASPATPSSAATASTASVPATSPAAPTPSAAYTFGGRKPNGGDIVLTGEVPSPVARTFFAQRAGNVPPGGLTVASGAPDDFVPSALAGIDALGQLDSGNFTFDGRIWSLSGEAGSLDARDTALAVIGALPAAKDWKVNIAGPSEIVVCTQIVTPFVAANPINFDARTTHFSKGVEPVLDTLAKDLTLCPSTRVDVQGNTDSDGAAAANMALSVARAEAVVAALAQRGINAQRLYAIGYGETLPLVPNTTKANKAKNRRIDFRFEAVPGK